MSASDCRSPITRAVRAAIATDGEHGAVVPPIHLSSTFAFEGFGKPRTYDYTRSGNPTRTLLETQLATLEGGSGAGAYAIARFRLRFGLERKAGLALLTLRIVPAVVILVPVYLLILQLKLIDTWAGLILVYTAFNITFCVWMMESFFHEIPLDLEEAAMVDGDSRLTAFIRIALPLAAPGLAATAIFAVIATFNEFLFALALTATPRAMTMPRGTGTLIGRINTDWASMAAAGVVGALPIVVFALLVQRHLVRGLTMGAVK